MNGMRNWLRSAGLQISRKFRRFMEGRYGNDKLNNAILICALAVVLLAALIRVPLINLLLHGVAYVLMFWSIARSLSRNTYKRYEENRRFLRLMDQAKDKDHRYYNCPKCKQTVRVPRGKGKIAITCPRCREKFLRKS